MTDEDLAAVYKLLAEHHRKLAKEAVLDVVQQYHADLAQRLVDEAALNPNASATVNNRVWRNAAKPTATNDPVVQLIEWDTSAGRRMLPVAVRPPLRRANDVRLSDIADRFTCTA